MFYPGKVENVQFMIDATSLGVMTSLPVNLYQTNIHDQFLDPQQVERARKRGRDHLRLLHGKVLRSQRFLAVQCFTQNRQG